MAEAFWPSLYARLAPAGYAAPGEAPPPDRRNRGTGTSPPRAAPPRPRPLIDAERAKAQVAIDLETLLNATNLESVLDAGRGVEEDPGAGAFADFPLIRRSALNHGMPALIGRHAYSRSAARLRIALRETLLAFEPRLDPETLRVEIEGDDGGPLDPDRPIAFSVEADIRALDQPLRLRIESLWRLSSGADRPKVEG